MEIFYIHFILKIKEKIFVKNLYFVCPHFNLMTPTIKHHNLTQVNVGCINAAGTLSIWTFQLHKMPFEKNCVTKS